MGMNRISWTSRPDLFWLLGVGVLQATLCLVAFLPFIRHPGSTLLYAEYDGIKNYFTPYSYISGLGQTPDGDALKVYGQHYPFGEYVFYTDNTPAISLPGRALAKLGLPMRGGGTGFFTYGLIGLHWASALALFVLLRQWLRTRWLAGLFAIALVWTCKQYWHYLIGSFNLGVVVLTVGYIGLLWRVFLDQRAWRPWLATGIWIAFASWFHLYYLIVYGTGLATFALVLIANTWREEGRDSALSTAFRAAAAGALGILLIYGPILLIDDKLALRTGESLGYGFDAWRLDIRSLITPRPELRNRFLVSFREQTFGEGYAYLGLWWWYALTFLLGLALWKGPARVWTHVRDSFRKNTTSRFIVAFGIAGTVCFFASLGTSYAIPGGDLVFEVALNPFYFIAKHSVTIQHFRAIGRFFFVTQWAWWLPILFILDWVWRRGQWPRAFVIVVAFCAVLDTWDAVRATKKQHPENPMFATATDPVLAAMPDGVDTVYQALLMAPYYHVGAQAPGLVADPINVQAQVEGFSFSAASRLPLLNAISSRTPPHEARALLDFVATSTVSDSLAGGLDARPILVAVHRDIARSVDEGNLDGLYVPTDGIARDAVLASIALPARVGVTKVGEYGVYDFYRWDWRTPTSSPATTPQ